MRRMTRLAMCQMAPQTDERCAGDGSKMLRLCVVRCALQNVARAIQNQMKSTCSLRFCSCEGILQSVSCHDCHVIPFSP